MTNATPDSGPRYKSPRRGTEIDQTGYISHMPINNKQGEDKPMSNLKKYSFEMECRENIFMA